MAFGAEALPRAMALCHIYQHMGSFTHVDLLPSRVQGFYAVYEGVFEKLARQEETAFERREERGRNNREFQFPARFGEHLYRRLPVVADGSGAADASCLEHHDEIMYGKHSQLLLI